MGAHLIDGEFRSDKYPTCPSGKVPLSVRDPTAQDLLWAYAQRRRDVDAEFSDDLETALTSAGYAETPEHARTRVTMDTVRYLAATLDAERARCEAMREALSRIASIECVVDHDGRETSCPQRIAKTALKETA